MRRWNLVKAAAYGAVCGILYALLRVWPGIESLPIARIAGNVVGGAIGGGVLFGLVAGLRNFLWRAR